MEQPWTPHSSQAVRPLSQAMRPEEVELKQTFAGDKLLVSCVCVYWKYAMGVVGWSLGGKRGGEGGQCGEVTYGRWLGSRSLGFGRS